MLRSVLVLLCAVSLALSAAPKKKKVLPPKKLSRKIEQIIQESPALARAHVGIRLTDLNGKVLYERNPRNWFVPASNTKLYSTALALTRLGPDYRMKTRVTAASAPVDGVLRGDVRLVGGGDPSLSSRAYPYVKDDPRPDAIPALEDLADQMVKAGVREISGGIVGDDTAYIRDPFPDGWGIDDPLFEYGAPVSALTLQDNAFRLEVKPGGAPGDPAEVSVFPEVGQLTIVPSVSTGAAGDRTRIRVERMANLRELHVEGVIGAGAATYSRLLAVEEPALYAARALQSALERRGVVVRGAAGARHRVAGADPGPDWPVVLAERQSPPLSELVKVVNKVSQNLHAELLLREVSRQGKPFGSREGGVNELVAFLTTQVGAAEQDVNFVDGSGLSRLTLLTPESTSKLLQFMAKSPAAEAWYESLPVAGEDGTLGRRFAAHKAQNPQRVRAKTGTLSHVSALGGYLNHDGAGRLVFTILVNNYNAASSEATKAMDKIVMTFLE